MMPDNNKCSLNNMLQAILSASAGEQNQTYPPSIYSMQYNVVSSWLLSKIAEVYPSSQRLRDISRPFLKVQSLTVSGGTIKIPTDCRNFLGAAISVKSDFSMLCGEDNPPLPQPIIDRNFKDSVNKSKCISRPIEIVDQSEWDYRTTDAFDFPTLQNPIGCFFDSDNLKICPFDIPTVEIRYFKNELLYRYGYIEQPDDTYIFDEDSTIETEWQTNAFDYIYRGLSALYGIYTRDNNFRDFEQELKKIGLT